MSILDRAVIGAALVLCFTFPAMAREIQKPLTASQHWMMQATTQTTVTIVNPSSGRSVKLGNERVTEFGDRQYHFEAIGATISPSERYVVVFWQDGVVAKYKSYEMDLVRLTDLHRTKLASPVSLGPLIWRKDERYLAATGNNTVRLWNLADGTVKLLPRPLHWKGQRAARDNGSTLFEWLGKASLPLFSNDGTRVATRYEIVQTDSYPSLVSELDVMYSVLTGEILNTTLVKPR